MALGNGARLPVGMAGVFPAGCHLVPDSITEAQDWDEAARVRTPAVDKITGKKSVACPGDRPRPGLGRPLPRGGG